MKVTMDVGSKIRKCLIHRHTHLIYTHPVKITEKKEWGLKQFSIIFLPNIYKNVKGSLNANSFILQL